MEHRGVLRWRSTLFLIGTIIGAGIFGVPAMIGAWGVVPATGAFIVLSFVILQAHLLYVEALTEHRSKERLVGQVRYWLGPFAGKVSGIVQALQVFGSNLAYIIIGGEFLAVIVRMCGFDMPPLVWQVVFWAFGSFLVFFGLRLVSRVEAFLTWALIGVILILIGMFIIKADMSLIFALPTHWTFEPYGVFLFSLLGITSLPETADIVHRKRTDVRKVIVRGTLTAALLTYLFGVTAWLASSGTLGRSPTDIMNLLPPSLVVVVPIFGLLAVITSYITTALDLQNLFHFDYRFPSILAWGVALGVPLALLFLTTRDFLGTIGLVGSVFGAAIAIIVSLIGRKAIAKRTFENWSTLFIQRDLLPIGSIIFFIAGGIAWILTT